MKSLIAAIALVALSTTAFAAEIAPYDSIAAWAKSGQHAQDAYIPSGLKNQNCTWKTNNGTPLCDPMSLSALQKDGLNPGSPYTGVFGGGSSGGGN